MTALSTVLLTIASVLAGSLIASLTTWLNTYLSTATFMEGEKYRQRLKSYQELWLCTKALRRTPEPEDLALQTLRNTERRLDDWYFSSGGLVLSSEARKHYFELVGSLQEVLVDGRTSISNEEYNHIYFIASALRETTATEVRGRVNSGIFVKRNQFD